MRLRNINCPYYEQEHHFKDDFRGGGDADTEEIVRKLNAAKKPWQECRPPFPYFLEG